jgi:hypothetical protein
VPPRFGPDGRATVQQVLDWTPTNVLGRALTIRFRFRPTAPEAPPLVVERTIRF